MALLFSFPWMPRNSSYPVAQKRGGKNTRQSFSHRTDRAPLFFVGQSVADVRGQGKRWLSYLLAPGQNHSRSPFIMLRNPHSNHPLSGGHRPSQPGLLHRPVLSPSRHAPASSHSLCPSTSPIRNPRRPRALLRKPSRARRRSRSPQWARNLLRASRSPSPGSPRK